MLQFDVRGPTTMAAINQYIGGYKTPEAALTDTEKRAPGGLKYLRDNYQALTGDFFADPFEDAIKARDDAGYNARMSAAMGSRGGGVVAPPSGAAPQVATVQRPDDWQPTATNWADREIQREAFRRSMERSSAMDRLNSPEMQLPTGDVSQNWADFQDSQRLIEKRMNLAGTRDLYDKIGPEVFSRGTTADDPRFARVQGGKDGKIEASDALHPIALHPEFIRELARNPQKAKLAYYAATNGRDYETDIAGGAQLRKEQGDVADKMIAAYHGLYADEITGQLYETGKLDSGGTKQPDRPLTQYEMDVVKSRKGTQRLTGVQVPGYGGMQLPGADEEGLNAVRTRAKELMREDPTLKPKAAFDMAHSQLAPNKVATSQSRPGLWKATDALENFMTSTVNTIPKAFDTVFYEPLRQLAGLDIPRQTGVPIRSEKELDERYERYRQRYPSREVNEEAAMAVLNELLTGQRQ